MLALFGLLDSTADLDGFLVFACRLFCDSSLSLGSIVIPENSDELDALYMSIPTNEVHN
jgi:hypothetical protein